MGTGGPAAGVAGAIVDRFENRRILIAVSLVQAATVIAMLAGLDSLWALLPLMTVLGFGVAVSQPAEFALVPAAAGPDTDAARANGLMETVRSLGFTAGPLVGGALGAAGLLWLAIALNALSFVVVAAAALLLRARRQPSPPRAPTCSVRARDGFTFLRRERDLRITLGGAVAALALFSIPPPPSRSSSRACCGAAASPTDGCCLSSWTVGMAAGSAGLAHRVGRRIWQPAALPLSSSRTRDRGGALATVVWIALIGFSLGGVAHGRQECAAPHADPRART